MSEITIAHPVGAQNASAGAFLFCDHAFNALPEECGGLGLSPELLASHIALDIGAADLTCALAERLAAPGLLCGFSRLLIDPTRSLDRTDLILSESDGVAIPGNQDLPPGARHRRITDYFEPYHERLDYEIEQICAAHEDPLIVSIHSFTRRLNVDPQDRPWHVGVLWGHDEATARAFMDRLGHRDGLIVGDNKPYDAREFNYSIDRSVAPLKLRHLTLEIRQDLISDAEGVARMIALLEEEIRALMR